MTARNGDRAGVKRSSLIRGSFVDHQRTNASTCLARPQSPWQLWESVRGTAAALRAPPVRRGLVFNVSDSVAPPLAFPFQRRCLQSKDQQCTGNSIIHATLDTGYIAVTATILTVINRRRRAPGSGTVQSPKVPVLLPMVAAPHPLNPAILTFHATMVID